MRTVTTGLELCFLLLASSVCRGVPPGETVRVGVYQNPPKVFITPDGKTTGLFPEVLDDVAKRHGWRIEYVPGTWQECLDRLEAGTIDLLVDVAVSEERREWMAFSAEPVLVNWGMVYARTDLPIRSFLDMQSRSVAVMRGSIHTEGSQGIKALTRQFGVACRFVEVDSYREVLMLLDSKQADVGVVNRLFGTLNADDFEVAPTPIIFNPRVLAFAAHKGNERNARLLRQIDEDLQTAKQTPDSVYHQVLAYYLGGATRDWQGHEQQYLHPLDLSPEQFRWIREHPVIRFSMDADFAPFEIPGNEGPPRGMAADFLNLVAQKTGLKFQLVRHPNWSDSLDALRDRRIDLVPCIGRSKDREAFLIYGEPYLQFARVVVTRLDSPVRDLADLENLRVGVQVDSSHDGFLKEHTSIQPRLYPTFAECLLAVSRGEVDAAVGNLAPATYRMQELALTNVKLACHAGSGTHDLSFGVRRDWPELAAILNRAMASITPQQRRAILAKWLPLPKAAATGLDLTRQEREWLLMHPRIRVAWDRSWAPIEFACPTDGRPQGISVEYIRALEGMLGVEFDMSHSGDWQSAYAKLKSGQLDMSSCLAITPERLKYLDFTETYLASPVVLFARQDTPYLCDMSELKGLRVAVVRDYATDEWMTRDHPDLPLTRVESIAEAFDRLGRGEIDVFVGSVLPGNYYLSKEQHGNIKVAGETPYTYKLRMAVRKDWPIFAGILRKALAAMPETDRTAFYRKWVWVKYEHGFDYSLLAKTIGVALLVILAFVYWNRRLRSEITRREKAQAALADSENALRTSYDDLKAMERLKDNLVHMIVHDLRSPLAAVSGSLELLADESAGLTSTTDEPTPLELAQAGAQSAMQMAQALLDISRLEAGKMPLHMADVDLQAVARDAIATMGVQARLADIRLVLSGRSVWGQADPEILHRVLIDLISNAIRASQAGTAVDVVTTVDSARAVVEVRDSGCGIPPDRLDAVFDRFASIDRDGRQRGAVGLGLSFCKLAVEAHGGRVVVESEAGKGSVFRVDLPLARCA